MQWTPWAVQQLLLESVSRASHHLPLQPAMLRVAVACPWLLTNPRTALVGTEAHQELGWESPETKALLLGKSSLDLRFTIPPQPLHVPLGGADT